MNLYLRLLLLSLFGRSRSRTDVWQGGRTPFRVLPNDLDVIRHLTNSRYLAFCDLARLDWLQRSGHWSQITARGWYPVVTAQTITYRRSLKLWEKFHVHSRMLGVDDRNTYVEQTFVRRGETVARAVVQARFLKRSGGSVSQSELEELVGGYPADLELPSWVKEWADSVRIAKTPEA